MSDRDPKDKAIPLTGPTQFAPNPTGNWEIYSLARQLPGIRNETHHYLALVDPKGNVVSEMHGRFTDHFSLMPGAGNYLHVDIVVPNRYMRDEPILGSPQSVYSGTQTDVGAKWNSAYDAVAKAIDRNHPLYSGDWLLGTYNSNSVWGTALRSIGINRPQDFKGPLASPGWETDLRTAPTNNDYIGTPDDSRWQPNPSVGVVHQSNTSPAGYAPAGKTAVSSGRNAFSSAARAVADAGTARTGAQPRSWRRRPDDLSSIDLVRELI